MAEFIRKNRHYRYHDKYCKKYLREDFNHKCAYCQILDGDIGGSSLYQKDHFIPQNIANKQGNVHDYSNLYYCCSCCNGSAGKSGQWTSTLLDPCKDQIFDEHISLDSRFVFIPKTSCGEEYISIIKLNSSKRVSIRKKIFEERKYIQSKIDEYEKSIESMDKTMPLYLHLSRDIEMDKERFANGLYYNPSLENDEIEDAQITDRIKKVLNVRRVYNEFDIDYLYEDEEVTYNFHLVILDEVKFTNGKKRVKIRKSLVEWWSTSLSNLYIIYFAKKDGKIYYHDFFKDTSSKVLQNGDVMIKLNQSMLLSSWYSNELSIK